MIKLVLGLSEPFDGGTRAKRCDIANMALYPRRILLCLVGLYPQLVTENLACLSKPQEQRPTEIHLVSTAAGIDACQEHLLTAGWLNRFYQEYGWPEPGPEIHLHGLHDQQGEELVDIRNTLENEGVADQLTMLVAELTADPNSSLHLSLAGGRKSMGFYAGTALSLFGRQQDQLSHVLVQSVFEANRDFYYPSANCLPEDNPLSVAEIPFVRLRGKIPSGPVTFQRAIEAVQEQLREPEIVIDTKCRTLTAEGVTCQLPHGQMALYSWLAQRRKAGLPHLAAPPEGRPNQQHAAELLPLYQAIRGPMGSSDRTEYRLRDGLSKDHFFEWRAKANGKIEAAWGPRAGHYIIQSQGRRPNSVYGLTLPPHAIHFV